MSRQLLPNELAEVVTGLLVEPQLLGELDTTDRHCAFIEAIGEVVAEFCGGAINGTSGPDGTYAGNPYADAPLLSVYPDDRIPGLNNCVWSPYDPAGWEDHTHEEFGLVDNGQLPSKNEQMTLRKQLQELLSEAHQSQMEAWCHDKLSV